MNWSRTRGRHVRRLALLMTAAIAAVTTASSSSASAAPGDTVIFTDNFETGQLSDRWTVVQGVNGSATIDSGVGLSGSRAAHLQVPDSTAGSIAYLRYNLPANTYAVSLRGSFRALSAGCNPDANYSSGNLPFFRLFDANNRRLVGVERINGPTCGDNTKVYVQHSGGFYRIGQNMKFNTWYQFELRATVGGTGTSLVQVFVNGSLKYSTTVASNGLQPFSYFTMHNEHTNQQGNMLIDDVQVATFDSGGPPPNPCAPSTPLPTNSDPGTVVLADSFESFDFSRWTQVDQGGNGTARVEVGAARSGNCIAHLHVTSTTESKANLQASLGTGAADVWADGWFSVAGEGASTSNVPTFRVFNGTARIVDITRQNGSGNMFLRLQNAGGTATFVALNRTWALGSWHQVKVHAVANATGPETIQIWLDGQLVHNSATYELGVSSFSRVFVGSEHPVQVMELLADDIVIKRA